jgi:ribonuclease J
VATDRLRIVPLGGLGEIGRNMLVIEYGDSMIVIDAGLMFPENDMLGIDIVIPDMQYVFERADKVKAIIITHGHEDHVGALPYLLEPCQGAGLCHPADARPHRGQAARGAHPRRRSAHHRPQRRVARPAVPYRVLSRQPQHPRRRRLGIRTPVGTIVHSGDFKFDHSPVDGQRTDFAKLAELGGRGVLLLLSDSTNCRDGGLYPLGAGDQARRSTACSPRRRGASSWPPLPPTSRACSR